MVKSLKERYKEYQNVRKDKIKEAEKEHKIGNYKKSIDIMNDIETLDNDNKDLINVINEKINEGLENIESENDKLRKANERALSDDINRFSDTAQMLYANSGSIKMDGEANIREKGEKMKDIFLNKSDKLTDRVKNSNDKEMEALEKDGAFAEVVRGIVTGKWDNRDIKNSVTTTATGVLIPEVISARVIDIARDKSLFGVAGVPTVPMSTNNMSISRVKKDPVFGFKKEGAEGKETSFELDNVKLKSKTAYGYAYVSLEAIKSSQNLDTILYKVFSEAMAQCIDNGFLYGQELPEDEQDEKDELPDGIMNDSAINSVVATEDTGYDVFIKAIGKIKASNGNPTALGINAQTDESLSLLKTSVGEYLTPPEAVKDLEKVVSNQLKYDEATGSDAVIFDPQALLIGIQNNIEIKIIEDNECLKKGLVGFRIFAMLDCKAVEPKNICKITGIK